MVQLSQDDSDPSDVCTCAHKVLQMSQHWYKLQFSNSHFVPFHL